MRRALLTFSLLVAAAAAAGAPAFAQAAPPGRTTAEDVKINQLIVYGEDPCPASSKDEITVCARRPENDRFRIPEALRDDGPDTVGNTAWTTRARELEYVGRSGIGSCTPIGPGGGIGCFDQLVRQALAERSAGDGTNWDRLIDEARQARLGKIDEKSEEIEQQVKEEEARKAAP